MKHIACNATKTVLFLGIMGLTTLGMISLPAVAQSDAPSAAQSGSSNNSGQALGDYARQIRKTSGPPSKPKVFDNDNLPKEDKLSVVGTARDASADTTATTASADAAAPAPAASGDAKAPAGPTAAGDKAPTKSTATDQAPLKATAPKTPEEEEAAKQAAWKQWSEKISSQKDQIDLSARELDVLQREYQIRAAAIYADVGNRMRNSADWDKQDADYKQKIADKQKALDDAKQKLEDVQEEARKAGVPASVREP